MAVVIINYIIINNIIIIFVTSCKTEMLPTFKKQK